MDKEEIPGVGVMLLISEDEPFNTRAARSPTTVGTNVELPDEDGISQCSFTIDEIITKGQMKDTTMQTSNTDTQAMNSCGKLSKNSESEEISSIVTTTSLSNSMETPVVSHASITDNTQSVLTKTMPNQNQEHVVSESIYTGNEPLETGVEMEYSTENQTTIPETAWDLESEPCENSNTVLSDIQYDKDTSGEIEHMDTPVSKIALLSAEQHCDTKVHSVDTSSEIADISEYMINGNDKTRDSGICLTRPNSPIARDHESPNQKHYNTLNDTGEDICAIIQIKDSEDVGIDEVNGFPDKELLTGTMETPKDLVHVTNMPSTTENQMTKDSEQNTSTNQNIVSAQPHLLNTKAIKSTVISSGPGDIKESIKLKIRTQAATQESQSSKRKKTRKKKDTSDNKRQKKNTHKTRNEEGMGSDSTQEETKQSSEMGRDFDKTNMVAGDSDEDKAESSKKSSQRKDIRKVKSFKKLEKETKEAQKIERERRKRIEEKQKKYNNVASVGETGDVDDVDRYKVPLTSECVLEADTDGNPIVEVDKTLVRKLKPHQVEAVRFMYDSCIESVQRLQEDVGSGCIIAHCMGLGKTLSVIAFTHTVLNHRRFTNMSTCLVVCPRNTVLNWYREFTTWQADLSFKIKIYELTKQTTNRKRAEMLEEWYDCGKSTDTAAVMIIGYEMYRNLLKYNKHHHKLRETFVKTLKEPGPDLVVCDECHVLRNRKSILSETMCNIKTKRRVALTGTPLQNNLEEYHCMVNFVKTNYLGTLKEFKNRFVNPIKNGQCSDSTQRDVCLMKKRAYVLHRMLEGFVQRKDYCVLKDYLPPKHEYVISVRLSSIQIDLYKKYFARGFNKKHLFKHFQTLARVWTHPWILKMRQERNGAEKTDDVVLNSLRKIPLELDGDGDRDRCTDCPFTPTTHGPSDLRLKDSTELLNPVGTGNTKLEENDPDTHTVIVDGSDSDKEDITNNMEKEAIQLISKIYSESEIESILNNVNNATYVIENEPCGVQPNIQSNRSNSDFTRYPEIGLKSDPLEACTQQDTQTLPYTRTPVTQDSHPARGNAVYEDISDDDDNIRETSPLDLNENSRDMVIDMNDNNTSSVWWEGLVQDDNFDIKHSGKLYLLFQILQMCEDIGDKILVFSQSLLTLDIIELFLRDETQCNKRWEKGEDYFRLDGSTNPQQRKTAQDTFNHSENHRARLFLISTKAGCLGINLVAANRVVIMDACWNPSHDIQAIFRSYRFGQAKPVYIYRLIAQGTMEEKIYERQVTKQSLAKRVVDEHQIERHFSQADLDELYSFTPDILDDPDRQERPLPALPKDLLLKELHATSKERICYFHEHDSLLENIAEQELSESEKATAWDEYERSRGKGNFRASNALIDSIGTEYDEVQQGSNSRDIQENAPELDLVDEIIKEETFAFDNCSPSSSQTNSVTVGSPLNYNQTLPRTSSLENNNLPLKKRALLYDEDAFAEIPTPTSQAYHQIPPNPASELADNNLHQIQENTTISYPDEALDLSLQGQSSYEPSITSQSTTLPILDYIPVPVCAELSSYSANPWINAPTYSANSSINPYIISGHDFDDILDDFI